MGGVLIIVECSDEKGAEAYELVVKQTLMDLQLGPSIDKMKVIIDPEGPLFISVLSLNKASKPIILGDITDYKLSKDKTKVEMVVKNENYLPDVLKQLWKIYGRENIHQPDRYHITIDDNSLDLDNIVVNDPEVNLRRRIYDAIYRIMPEGFRVIKDLSEGNIVALLSTDELLKDEWIQQTKDLILETKNY